MTANMPRTISVAVPTRNRAASLICCIGSILRNDCPELLEILVIANPDDKATLEFCMELAKTQPKIRLELSEPACRNISKNHALEKARGEYVYFLDDDIILPHGNLKALLDMIDKHPAAAALGGPNITPVNSPNNLQQAIGAVLLQPFATFMTRARYVPAPKEFRASENSLQSCNLCLRKSVLERWPRPFEPTMFSGEETLLLYRMKKAGLELYSSPTLYVEHHRRSTFFSFCRQIFLCGAGRAQMSRLEHGSFQPIFAIPSLFLIYLLALAAALPLRAASPLLWPLYAYAGMLFLSELTRPLNPKISSFSALKLTVSLHLCYGAGFLAGLAADKRSCGIKR